MAGRRQEHATSGILCARRESPLTYVIVEPCIGEKNARCVDVCPVSCIYEAPDM